MLKLFKKYKSNRYTKISLVIIVSALLFNIAHVYAKITVKNEFIEKMNSKGIDATLSTVAFNLNSIDLKNAKLRVKESEIIIGNISTSYSLDKIHVKSASVKGDFEDYLSIVKKENVKQKSNDSYKKIIILEDVSVDINLYGKDVFSNNISMKNGVIEASEVKVDSFKLTDLYWNLASNNFKIQSITKINNKTDKEKIKKSISRDEIPELPNLRNIPNINAKIAINEVNIDNFLVNNITIDLKNKSNLDLNILANKIGLEGDDYYLKSNSVYFEISEQISGIDVFISTSNLEVLHRTISKKGPFEVKNIELNTFIKPNSDSLSFPKLLIKINELMLNGSFSISNGSFRDFVVKLEKIECKDLIKSIPDTWKKTLEPNNADNKIKYTGDFEAVIHGNSSENTKLKIQSSCDFINVPPMMQKNRFKKVFNPTFPNRNNIGFGPYTSNWVPLNMISENVQKSLLTTEDATFFRHMGVNKSSIVDAFISFFKNGPRIGGSTITMQLAKNLWLNGDKTLSRKVEEFLLTLYLENVFSKNEILELYLNIVEFGPNIYGIYNASMHYFKTPPIDLSLKQSLFLTSILPKPKASYFTEDQLNKSTDNKLNYLLKIMKSRGSITEKEYEKAKNEKIIR